jgi:hypothetical protein
LSQYALALLPRRHISCVFTVSQIPDPGSDRNITGETVIHYHSQCIAELRVLASEPQAVMDEDLLAAVVVLRFFEELDSMPPLPACPSPAPTPKSNSLEIEY